MDGRRNYHQYCGLAKALDVVGERWTLLIVRNLTLGPQRYADLMRGLPGITTNLLAKRLKEMESAGLVEHLRQTYHLTELGRDLEPALHALGAWGFRQLGAPASDDHRDIAWLMVALRRRYLGGRRMIAEFVADGVPYRFELQPEHGTITRTSAPDATLRVSATAPALAQLFLGGYSEELKQQLSITRGSEENLRALLIAFKRRD